MMQLLQRRKHTDPTAEELREQHRDVSMKLANGRIEVAAEETRVEEMRMRLADLRDADPLHTDVPDLAAEVQQAETELADLQAQQRFRERKVASLAYAVRVAESREAPGLQTERAARHDDLRRGLPDRLRRLLVAVETLQSIEADVAQTAYQYNEPADVLPVGAVLDNLRLVLGSTISELDRYDSDAETIKERMAPRVARLVES